MDIVKIPCWSLTAAVSKAASGIRLSITGLSITFAAATAASPATAHSISISTWAIAIRGNLFSAKISKTSASLITTSGDCRAVAEIHLLIWVWWAFAALPL